MSTTNRVRHLRLAKAIATNALAERLAISTEAFDEIERYDDELASALSIEQVMYLAQVLGVQPWELFGDSPPEEGLLSGEDLAGALRQHMRAFGESVDQVEEEVGWSVHELLQQPEQVIRSSPALFLQDLGTLLQLNWLRLLPASSAA